MIWGDFCDEWILANRLFYIYFLFEVLIIEKEKQVRPFGVLLQTCKRTSNYIIQTELYRSIKR